MLSEFYSCLQKHEQQEKQIKTGITKSVLQYDFKIVNQIVYYSK